jgi:hypothetical protein
MMTSLLIATSLLVVAPQRAKPVALLLDAQGAVEVRSAGGTQRVRTGDLLFPGDRLAVPRDGAATLAILGVGVREQIKPGAEATIGPEGCTPPGAVAWRKPQAPPVAKAMKGVKPVSTDGRRAGIGLRAGPGDAPAIMPIFGALVATDRPELAWPPRKAAKSYRVRLFSPEREELWRADTTDTRLPYPESRRPLEPDNEYRWEVVARIDRRVAEGESIEVYASVVVGRFTVATRFERAAIEELKALAAGRDRADRLEAALGLARMDAFAEAIAVYESLVAQAPEEPYYRQELAELRRRAGHADDAPTPSAEPNPK